MLLGIPAAVVDAAEQAEQLHRVDVAAPGHAVLPVGGEGHVGVGQGSAGADLGGFLTEEGGPDAELALPLQGHGLKVDAPYENQVPVEGSDLLRSQVDVVVGVLDPLSFGGEELNELGGCFGTTRGVDCHVPLLCGRGRSWWGRHLRPAW